MSGSEFRAIAAARVARIERAWRELLKSSGSDAGMRAEVQALGDEAHLLGFPEVHVLCQRLDDLFAMAATVGHVVDDEFDLVVGMALRFVEMMSRKRADMSLGGVDLQAFYRQIDQVVRNTSHGFGGRTRTGTPVSVARPTGEVVSPSLRATLSTPAADAFIEYAAARGHRRNRLRAAWHVLRGLVEVPLPRVPVRGHVLRVTGVPFPVMLEGWAPTASPTEAKPLDIALILGLSQEAAVGTTRSFSRGTHEIAVVLSGPSYEADAVRVVTTYALYDVVMIDTKEGLLFHPELMR